MLVTAKGTYMQPMLISQVNYLYGIVRRADQVPGRDVYQRLQTLQAEKAELEAMMD
jgi:GDP-D-mannose dehydratase